MRHFNQFQLCTTPNGSFTIICHSGMHFIGEGSFETIDELYAFMRKWCIAPGWNRLLLVPPEGQTTV